jgi:hypothetical protein
MKVTITISAILVFVLVFALAYLGYIAKRSPSIIGGGYDAELQNQSQAVKALRNTPSVQEWLKLFNGPHGTSPTTGGKPIISLESETNEAYVYHAYEDMPDHTVTFGRYIVNKKTYTVTRFK